VVEMAEEAARRYMDQHADEVEQNRREREAERQAEQRQREEERRREEEEKRREAERIAKAQAETAAKVTEWADRLERVKNPGGKIYHFNNDKDRAAFVATTKRNIKAVINHYFPGLKVTVTISGEIYKEKFIINWVDGPSADTLRATCKELFLFVPTFYASDPYADYGSHY
jgi:ATP-dependent 26S proteasome regulatory subunit